MICIAPVVRRTAITAALATLVLVASAACSNGGGEKASAGANPTVATDPPTTTTTNPYAVPAVIDVAYVNRVLAGLDAAMGDVVRLVLRTRTIPREAYDRLRAIYGNDQWFQSSIDSFQADLRRNFSTYKSSPGNKVTTVSQLLTASPRCIFAKVQRDYSEVATNPAPPETQWIALKPLSQVHDPIGYNPTTWALFYDGFAPNRGAPPDPCAS